MRLQCPQCGTTIDAEAGGRASCPSCGFSADIPGGAAPSSSYGASSPYTARPYGAPAGGGWSPPPSGPAPGGHQAPPPQYAQYQPPPKTNGFCTAALVLGLVGICPFFVGLPSLLALIFGIVGYTQANKNKEGGQGMAIAGIVLGALFLLGWMFFALPFWEFFWEFSALPGGP